MRFHRIFWAAAIVSSLSACSVQSITQLRNDVQTQDAAVRDKLASQPTAVTDARRNQTRIQMIEGAYVSVRRAEEVETEHFMQRVGAQHIAANRDFAHIGEVAGYITQKLGVGVAIAPDVWVAPGGTSTLQTAASGATGSSAPGTPIPTIPSAARAAGLTGVNVPTIFPGSSQTGAIGGSVMQPVWLIYDGALTGFADVAASRFSVSWEWAKTSNGTYGIRFFRYTTRVFRLVALPGDTNLESSISNSPGGSGSGTSGSSGATGSSNQNTGVSFSSLSVWKAAGNSIGSMMSPGRSPVVSPATGEVTVTDTPEVLDQVEHYVERLNASLSMQVVINVRVLSVDLTDSNQRGIDWDVVYKSLSGNFGLNFTNAFTAPSDASSLTLKILSTAGTATNSTIQSWQGSNAIIHSLETQGRVSQTTSGTLTTLNNQVAPLQSVTQTSYLASSTTNTQANAGATTTLQPGVINTGFSMSVVPHILDARRLLLQYSVNLSSLLSLTTVTSNGSSIQTPNIDTRNFLQRVMMSSGETLVMTGFEQAYLNGRSEGVVDAQNPSAGGAVSGQRNRSVLVILLQPVVVGG